MSQMIQYEIYCRRPRVVTLCIVGDFIGDNGGNFYTKKINCKGKSYCMRFFFFVWCVNDVQHVCARMVAILHIGTFVTIGSNPSLISRLIWTQSNELLGLNWR